MTITEIATDLRVALVNYVNRDESVSLTSRISFIVAQFDSSDEEVISFWLSVSEIEDHQVPMFVVRQWAKKATNIVEWMTLLERNTTPPENNESAPSLYAKGKGLT
jgi:hypothetical protein